MNLPRLAIENHQFTSILILLLVIFGLVSFVTMPRSEDPLVSPAGSSIVVVYPGADPADMEELVVDPLEEVINELEDIKVLTSLAQDGLAVVAVEFLTGSDPDEKYSDVVQKVNSIRNDLPEAILDMNITKWSITDVNILQLALYGDSAGYRALEREAQRLKHQMERISGVQKVKIWAYPEQEIRISVNAEKMASYHLGLNQVTQAIIAANQNIPGGSIDVGTRRFNIQSSGSYADLEEIKNTIVHSRGGKIVFLRDIATVTPEYEDINYQGRFQSQKAIFITVSQKPATNIFTIRESIQDKLDTFEAELPKSMHLAAVFDQSQGVAKRISNFFVNLLQGLVLVGIVVFLAVGLIPSGIVIIVIPISILIGVGFIDLSGFGLQQMTITGMVIALGLLVDNAIVVIENISRFMRSGYSAVEAAVLGTGQIAWAIVSSTATTILAFIPMILMQNVTGDFIRSMPVTVVYTLSASLLISILLTPYLSSKYLHYSAETKDSRLRSRLNWFIETVYRRQLAYALSHPARILILTVVVFIASLGLFPFIGVSFFPKAEKPQLLVNIDTPDGSSLDQTRKIALQVEDILKDQQNIVSSATNIGHGNPRIYYNIIPKNITSTHAQIFVILDKFEPEPYAAILSDLRRQFDRIPGARIEVKEFEQGPPVNAPVEIRILGDDLEILKRIAADIEQMIAATDGTININNPLGTTKTDLHILINREKAGILGIPLAGIDQTIRAAIAGIPVSSFRDREGKEYNIILRLPFEEKIQLSDLKRIYVSSFSGAQIPLDQLATLEFRASPVKISHYNMERSVTLTSDVIRDVSVDKVTRTIIAGMDDYAWPRGYSYAIGGEAESREESFGGMLQAILVALIGIFAVLVLQFRSYSQPLIVFSAIPLAVIGSMLALLITGYSFSFTAFIGITSLVGIVINNSIILVDYTNQLRRSGKDIIEALKEAGETRFMPIILTTATTISGLLPLTLAGGTLWAPMGWTIIGGLAASTLLTLMIVPVLYLIYSGKSD